jgi:hypothetical protein
MPWVNHMCVSTCQLDAGMLQGQAVVPVKPYAACGTGKCGTLWTTVHVPQTDAAVTKTRMAIQITRLWPLTCTTQQ